MPRRAVADSNVVVSGLYGHGNPRAVLELARQGEVNLYVSPFILYEVRTALGGPHFDWAPARIADALFGLPVYIIEPGRPRLHVLADEADNRILESALAARARYLVTGDRRLRRLGKYRRVRVLTPRAFLTLIRSA